jgi:hypothetical protein
MNLAGITSLTIRYKKMAGGAALSRPTALYVSRSQTIS